MIVRKLKYILVIAIVCIFPNIVHADCSYERMAELSRIASNVQFSYEYEMNENGTPNFTVLISNLTNDIFIKDKYNNILNGQESVQKYTYNETHRFDIYSNDQNCYGEKLLTKYVTLPPYNNFANTKECKENPNFEYCQIWKNTYSLTKDKFDELLENSKTSEKIIIQETTEDSDFEKIINFLKENYYIFIVIIVLILMIIWKRKLKN